MMRVRTRACSLLQKTYLAHVSPEGLLLSTDGPAADTKVAIARAGGNEAVLRALAMHPDNAGVQQEGCVALANLAYNNGALSMGSACRVCHLCCDTLGLCCL